MRHDAWWLLGAGVILAAAYKAPDIRAALAQAGDAWQRLHPEVKARAQWVMDDANREFAPEGLRVGVFDGYRAPGAQAQHVAAGSSFVAHPLDSFHPWGLAVDFVFLNRLGNWTWLEDRPDQGREQWYALGRIIERYGFEWGGRWGDWGSRSFDGPHAQLPIARPAQLRAAYPGGPEAWLRSFA